MSPGGVGDALVSAVPAVHLVATLAMAGLILFVQVVHYPLMGRVGRAGFREYEAAHTVRTGALVVPLMVAELVTALWLAGLPPSAGLRPAALLGAGLVLLVWLSTALLQVPAHRALSRGWDEGAHRRLVKSNWVRTAAWWARVPLAVLLAG